LYLEITVLHPLLTQILPLLYEVLGLLLGYLFPFMWLLIKLSIEGECMPGKGYKPKKANKKNKVRKK
jgi:hypothetical protein